MKNLIRMLTVVMLTGTIFAASPAMAQNKGKTNALKKTVNAQKGLSKGAKTFTINTLLPITMNNVFIKSTAEQNAKGITLAAIQKDDDAWKAAEEELPIQKEKLNNACAQEMKRVVAKNPTIIEAFVMDNQGAVVCENALTSDYWQGDEAKWTNSFNGGKGGIDVGDVEFDKSANAKLQQISLPIFDKSGKAIGAITFGVNVTSM